MASIIGTTGDDTITPDGVSAGVTGGIPSDADDTILGLGGDDSIEGGGGDDSLLGGYGSDTLFGGVGNDTLEGGGDYGILNGGDGNDLLLGGNDGNALIGGAGDDTIQGGYGDADYSAAASGIVVDLPSGIAESDGDGGRDVLVDINRIFGSDFADHIVGSEFDWLFGGAGDDTLVGAGRFGHLAGGAGNDVLRGEDPGVIADYSEASGSVVANLAAGTASNDGDGGSDVLIGIPNFDGSEFADRVYGNNQENYLLGHGGSDTLLGGIGNDSLTGGEGGDTVRGGDGDDSLDEGTYTESGDDRLDGGRGNDSLYGDGGDDTLIGGDGDDQLDGGTDRRAETHNQIYGGAGDDRVRVSSLTDGVWGGEGNDTAVYLHMSDDLVINVGAGTVEAPSLGLGNTFSGIENVSGGQADDRITGTQVADQLAGDSGDDTLIGKAGDDTLDGGYYNDSLRGGDGADSLVGGVGNDRLIGGLGADRFVYSFRNGGDVIADFQQGVDRIEINGYGAALDSFSDLDIRQIGGNAQIFLSTSVHLAGVIILAGIDAHQLDATDFLFS